ncbi:unnamed protein product [Prunus armeniaca]|uniref:Uncharacterized protein n=1 Tax=Prunus armeniaca TaxID=36596 RepID=A0A6J5UY51_PRUAR|nr:unnamed protein product [Prunus armeniaca]CAB4310972.1 unnamed protein product [Prunus armeniaca]
METKRSIGLRSKSLNIALPGFALAALIGLQKNELHSEFFSVFTEHDGCKDVSFMVALSTTQRRDMASPFECMWAYG